MIGLMDCNNFFVSCERLFRPDLTRLPVLVLSSNDGCVISRSQEVKDMGISMGIPYFQIKDMCFRESITVFSSNFALYKDMSSRVMAALKDEFPILEKYSIDEAFFVVDDTYAVQDLEKVRARIIQKTGIPVSIGVAKTKTLAKVAAKIAKGKEGVFYLDESVRGPVLEMLPCGSVWGIGRKLSSSLAQMQVDTVGQFLNLDSTFVAQKFGLVGARLYAELQGDSIYSVGVPSDHEQESFMSTRSFGSVTHDKSVLKSAVSYHCMQVGEKLRARKQVGSRLTVIARGGRYGAFSHREGSISVDFTIPTNDVFEITKEALKLVDILYDSEIPYKKAGVIVGGILPLENVSCSLFSSENSEDNKKKLNSTIDVLNGRFGKSSVQIASALHTQVWKEKKNLLSKEYTTNWNDIPKVKAI